MIEIFSSKCSKEKYEDNPESYFCLTPKNEECYDDKNKYSDKTESITSIISQALKCLEKSHKKIVTRKNKNPLLLLLLCYFLIIMELCLPQNIIFFKDTSLMAIIFVQFFIVIFLSHFQIYFSGSLSL